jgi:thiamine-phosphate pyrophosphorylase
VKGSRLSAVGYQLLLITDGFDASTVARVEAAVTALPRGAAAVLLRAKALDGRALYKAAERLRTIASILIVHDRLDVALAVGADGVHLPAAGLPVAEARRLGGARLLVGASTHARGEAEAATRDGADYVVFGPVWPSPGKSPPVGVAALAEVVRALARPVFALGGVDAAHARECVAVGAGVACIRAVLGRDHVAEAARDLFAAMG